MWVLGLAARVTFDVVFAVLYRLTGIEELKP